jgi:hypothetical protein
MKKKKVMVVENEMPITTTPIVFLSHRCGRCGEHRGRALELGAAGFITQILSHLEETIPA